MDAVMQLAGLDRFLNTVYGAETSLATMLDELGFEPAQAQWLRDERMQVLGAALIEALRAKLTRGNPDLWFRVINRRYGLDGQPGESREKVAEVLSISPEQAALAETDALQKCRYKVAQQDFRSALHRRALEELSSAGAMPAKEAVVSQLRRLADLNAALDLTRMDYEAKRAEVLKAVQAELDALEAEYDPLLDAAQKNASALEAEIKNNVLLGGESVTTDVSQAIYMKGRVTWDTSGIDKYAQLHPEVLKYRKEGQPSVALRTVK
jgi:hypothetical protein